MESKYIGLCALFRGVEAVSEFLKLPKEEVRAYRSLVSYKSIPFFEALRGCIVDVVKRVGVDGASRMLSISLISIFVITEESSFVDPFLDLKLAFPSFPLPGSTSTPLATAKGKKDVAKYMKTKVQNNVGLEARQFGKRYDNPVTDLNDLEDLKHRVSRLYNHGVDIKVIMSLYDLQNKAFIHAWGGFDRCKLHDKTFETKQRIVAMREDGINDGEICKNLGLKLYRMKEIMGEMKRKKLIFMKKDIKKLLYEHEHGKRRDKVAQLNGVTDTQIDYWKKKKAAKQLDTVFDLQVMDPIDILSALESYYIHENAKAAAEETGMDERIMKVLVKKFESKMNEYYTNKKGRTKWNKKCKRFYGSKSQTE